MLSFLALSGCSLIGLGGSSTPTPTGGTPSDWPAACEQYIACATELADSSIELETTLARYGEDGSCFDDPALLALCTTECEEGLADFVESTDGEAPDVCWSGDPCETVTYAHARCPDALAFTGPLQCLTLSETEESCVADAVETCASDADDAVGACLGLEPGTFRRAIGPYTVSGTDVPVDTCNIVEGALGWTHEAFADSVQLSLELLADGDIVVETITARTITTCAGSDPVSCSGRASEPPSDVDLELTWTSPTTYTGVYTVTTDDGCALGVAIEGSSF